MKKWIVIVLVVVAAVIIYVAVNWPLSSTKNTQGTLGGVQKAEKFKGKQLSKADLKIKDPELVKFSQSAEWQNAMKDKEFVKLFFNQDFQNYMKFSMLSGELVTEAAKLHEFFSKNNFNNMNEDEFKNKYKLFFNSDTNKLYGNDINKLWTAASDFQKAIKEKDTNGLSQGFLKIVLKNTTVGNRILKNKNFAKMFALDMNKNGIINPDDLVKIFWSIDVQKLYNGDMQKLMSTDFQDIVLNADFQKIFFNSDIQKLLGSDFQKSKFFSSDMQKLFFNNPNMQKILANSSFQQAMFRLHSSDFNNFLNNQIDKYGLHNIVKFL